jgi:adenylylsulfate kinase-like enzyme
LPRLEPLSKGLYKKAQSGEIPDFTGVSAPYEDPTNPDLRIDTGKLSVEDSIALLMDYIDKVFRL